MGIDVVLLDERGSELSEAVQDRAGVIAHSLPELTDTSFACIRFVDPYGDTVFNRLQAAVAVEEWDRLETTFSERGASTLWADVRNLLVHCSQEPHTYVRFIGD